MLRLIKRNILRNSSTKGHTTMAEKWQMEQLKVLGGEKYLEVQTNDKRQLPRFTVRPDFKKFVLGFKVKTKNK